MALGDAAFRPGRFRSVPAPHRVAHPGGSLHGSVRDVVVLPYSAAARNGRIVPSGAKRKLSAHRLSLAVAGSGWWLSFSSSSWERSFLPPSAGCAVAVSR